MIEVLFPLLFIIPNYQLTGYNHDQIIRADQNTSDNIADSVFEYNVHWLRVVVEIIFGIVKRYSLAADKCRLSVRKQILALRVIYQLVNRILKKHKLRSFPEGVYTLPTINAAGQVLEEDLLTLNEAQVFSDAQLE